MKGIVARRARNDGLSKRAEAEGRLVAAAFGLGEGRGVDKKTRCFLQPHRRSGHVVLSQCWLGGPAVCVHAARRGHGATRQLSRRARMRPPLGAACMLSAVGRVARCWRAVGRSQVGAGARLEVWSLAGGHWKISRSRHPTQAVASLPPRGVRLARHPRISHPTEWLACASKRNVRGLIVLTVP